MNLKVWEFKRWDTSYLLFWSLFVMEALKCVVSFLQNESHHLKPKWEI